MDRQELLVDYLMKKVHKLNELGIALSAEKNLRKLLDCILLGAKELTNADGGSLYTVTGDEKLKFELVSANSLGLHWGGAIGVLEPVPEVFPDIPLYLDDGRVNDRSLAVHCVINRRTVNIDDVYNDSDFDLSGTLEFDKRTGYQSKSLLAIPLSDNEDRVIGVLQLFNAQSRGNGDVVSFTYEDQCVVESLSSQAAVAMTKQQLVDDLRKMLEALIKVLADSIDAKSEYTGKHCRRVPALALMLAEAVNVTDTGPLAGVTFSKDELYELYVAAMLHDCGKVVTPVHVVDKKTKLETLFDRIELIETRFEVLKRDIEIDFLKNKQHALESGRLDDVEGYEDDMLRRIKDCDDDLATLRRCNHGSEAMADEDLAFVKNVAKRYRWQRGGVSMPCLSDDEVVNLSISKGTLSEAERAVIDDHVVMSIKMLGDVPYPDHLKNVPEIAGAHHERINGEGYPRGLVGTQMSLQARILALADIFEALTAADRPYKAGMSLSQALAMLESERDIQHIDSDVYDVFIRQCVPLKYACQYLDSAMIDI